MNQLEAIINIAESLESIKTSIDPDFIHLTKEQFNQVIACAFETGYRMQFGNVVELTCDELVSSSFDCKVKPLELQEHIEVTKIIKMYLDL